MRAQTGPFWISMILLGLTLTIWASPIQADTTIENSNSPWGSIFRSPDELRSIKAKKLDSIRSIKAKKLDTLQTGSSITGEILPSSIEIIRSLSGNITYLVYGKHADTGESIRISIEQPSGSIDAKLYTFLDAVMKGNQKINFSGEIIDTAGFTYIPAKKLGQDGVHDLSGNITIRIPAKKMVTPVLVDSAGLGEIDSSGIGERNSENIEKMDSSGIGE